VNEDDRRQQGERTRREVLGDSHVDAAAESASELTEDFQNLITRYAWGEIWTRRGIERRTRSLLTIALLVALGRDEELEMHLHAALRIGVSEEEIRETLLHCAIYCGVPAANSAFAIAQRALEDEQAEPEEPRT
jgi:4-carboxymuconolactone decarboxylase